jgi:hypothetical protein
MARMGGGCRGPRGSSGSSGRLVAEELVLQGQRFFWLYKARIWTRW